MVKAGSDVLQGEASDVEDEVNAIITDFVAYYQLHQHDREEENHIVPWYGRFQGFPFFDDLCHIVLVQPQSRAKNPATFACDQCTKKFTRNRNLQSHLLAHKVEKPYGCPMCDMRFARDSDRKRHEKLHTGEKKFVCKGRLEDGGKMWPSANWGCEKAFPRAEALNNHFRSKAGKACPKSLLEAYLNEDMLEEHLMH